MLIIKKKNRERFVCTKRLGKKAKASTAATKTNFVSLFKMLYFELKINYYYQDHSCVKKYVSE